MLGFIRVFTAAAIIATFTGAANLLYTGDADTAKGLAGIITVVFLVSALIASSCFLEQQADVRQSITALSELLIAFGLLYFPIFLGDFWIGFVPAAGAQLGATQILLVVVVVVLFWLTLYLSPREREWIPRVGLVIYVASVLADLVVHGLLTSALKTRPAGFLSNANDGAAILSALMLLSLPWREPSGRGYFWCAIACVGVLLTLSRTGLVIWLLFSSLYAGSALLIGRPRAKLITCTTLVAAFVGGTALISAPRFLAKEIGLPLRRIESVVALANGDTASLNNSGRGTLFRTWVRRSGDAPLFGNGSQYSVAGLVSEAHGFGPHNMLLARLNDQGLLGLVSFFAFFTWWAAFFAVRRHFVGVVFTFWFFYVCMFSHNALDNRAMLSLFGFLAADACQRATGREGRSQPICRGRSGQAGDGAVLRDLAAHALRRDLQPGA